MFIGRVVPYPLPSRVDFHLRLGLRFTVSQGFLFVQAGSLEPPLYSPLFVYGPGAQAFHEVDRYLYEEGVYRQGTGVSQYPRQSQPGIGVGDGAICNCPLLSVDHSSQKAISDVDTSALTIEAGVESAPAYRLALSLAFWWHDPGKMRVPIPRGGNRGKLWRQTRRVERYPVVTNTELLAMTYPGEAFLSVFYAARRVAIWAPKVSHLLPGPVR